MTYLTHTKFFITTKILLLAGLCAFSIGFSYAQTIEADRIYSGNDIEVVEINDVVESIIPGSILIIGEYHGTPPYHVKQLQLLNALANRYPRASISVGMEHFAYPIQALVDQYLMGELSEIAFLGSIAWKSPDFAYYRPLVYFPQSHQGQVIALNSPRWFTTKIWKNGLDSLSAAERTMLPPNFALGNQLYRERFFEYMSGGHIPPGEIEKLQRYFEAQSTWDDTMAWKAVDFMWRHPDSILVIIVGDFHLMYGGGLPDRIHARSNIPVVTVSQENLAFYEEAEYFELVAPHERWGQRADFVWISEHPKSVIEQ